MSVLTIRLLALLLFSSLSAITLFGGTPVWALVNVPEANVRTEPRHVSELSTQAIAGTPLRVLEESGEWCYVELPDGYTGWTNSAAIVLLNDSLMQQWRSAPRLIVTGPYLIPIVSDTLSSNPGNIITSVTQGTILASIDEELPASYRHVALPDGRAGWISASLVQPLDLWANQPFDPALVLDTAFGLMGTSYLWGGTTPKAVDCSGLIKVAFLSNGFILPRDASQQALIGERVEALDPALLSPADLLFFTNDAGKVVHVALYESKGNYIHSSGHVRYNNFLPSAANYLNRPVAFGTRFSQAVRNGDIPSIASHPWYFNLNK